MAGGIAQIAVVLAAAFVTKTAAATTTPTATPAVAAQSSAGSLYIQEYRVEGAHLLPRAEVEGAIYPFLGPGRTADDVEQARAALEKAYKDQGYQAAAVQIPPQQVRGGIVFLQVTEGQVGRLRVHGSRYFSLAQIKQQATSLTEGKVVNFNDVTHDIVALNQLPDRRITPSLRAGAVPGTVDIDLNVKDTLPLHGSLELNNRYSANTTPLRINGSVSYNNLWQLGHSLGASFQIAPQNPDEAKVFSGYYLVRFPNMDWLTLSLQGTKQDSNVSTIGGIAVAGRGEIIGARAIVSLPTLKDFYHSLSLGIDYKHFDQNVMLGLTEILAPITYYPLSVLYTATWAGKGRLTELNAGLVFHIRGLGSDALEFENSRFKSDGGFIVLRGDLTHTQELPAGFQLYGKVQGQVANEPLVSAEQFSAGGLGTARGYLEGEVPGDNAAFGTIELRSPSLLGWMKNKESEWRLYAFADGGILNLRSPLPEQKTNFSLASLGAGTRIKLFDYLNASLDAAVPLLSQTTTEANELLLTFRVWAEF